MVWYDTTNNLMKYTGDGGSTWTSGWSFPICIIHGDGTQISNIDQVFNGFGYIGSAIFALPGVKGLIPNGRNADGSLKNIEFQVSNVVVQTNTYLNRDYEWFIYNNGSKTEIGYPQISSRTQPTGNYQQWYNFETNQSYNTVTGTASIRFSTPVLRFVVGSDSRITSFTPKTAFHAVDWNELDEKISNFAPKITAVSETSGTVMLAVNKIYTMSISGATTFTLPTSVDTTVFNQIKVMATVTGTPTITWGTTNFFNKTTPEIEDGNYDVYFDYDNLLGAWVAGVLSKGAES